MRNKVLKIGVILVMILSMTMTNFIFVGSNLISYAADSINGTTNHKNIEFKAYFKKEAEEKNFLYLHVNVKKEGYFNGEIKLEDSNFVLKDTDSSYVNKIENNTIYLNQMNAGITEEIKVRIEPIKEESFVIGLLNMTSKINLTGIYRDRTQKDIKIQADREVVLEIEENNTAENMKNEIEVITNKAIEINGETKRILQFSYHMGLKENNYPIQEIEAQISIPTINGKVAEVQKVEYLNNMKSIEEEFDGTTLLLTLKNEMNEEGKVNWKTTGDENVIITCLYDETESIENLEILANERVTLYNNKKLEAQNKIEIEAEEIDHILEVITKNKEETIYKGKLNAGIDRNYETTTQIKINFAKVIPVIEITEENSQDVATIIYQRTTLKKEQFDKLFGADGIITISSPNGNVMETITSQTPADEQGNIVINYENGLTGIKMQTTEPVQEGTLELCHTKTIHTAEQVEKVKNAEEIKTTVKVNEKETENIVKLENATTQAILDVNKDSLSTVIANEVEIKAVLVSNDEKYDLYKNPEIAIQLPEQVENITINSIDLLYENELKIKNYFVDGRMIRIILEGEQTQYKEAIEGATVVINTTIDVNRKATTKDEVIQMTYKNNEVNNTITEIQIVAPTDVTPIYSVQALGIETVGHEETREIVMARGMEEKQLEAQIEIINNKENTIKNVKVLGDFPTNHKENNMGIEISSNITLQGIENAKIYYSENPEATDDLQEAKNGWTDTIADASKVAKYLINLEALEARTSVMATYTYKVPANLEYNQMAITAYQAIYVDSSNNIENEVESTMLDMKTGIGPRIETKLTATVGGKQVNGPVKNGEVIKYSVAISNTGTEDASNVKVTGQVPEGTTMVQSNFYYEEIENRTYEETIETLKAGEVIYKEYEVRVNSETTKGTTLTNKVDVKYGDVTKQTNEITLTTEEGTLRVTTTRRTDEDVALYPTGVIEYGVKIENISNQKQENVKIKTNLSDNTEVKTVSIWNNLENEEEEAKYELLDYSKEMNIGSLEAGQVKELHYGIYINELAADNNRIDFSISAIDGNHEHQSNIWNDEVKYMEIAMGMTANTESQYVKAGDIIEYTINITNQSNFETAGLAIVDSIPSQLVVKKVTRDGEEIASMQENDLKLLISMGGKSSTTIKIETVVNYSQAREKAEAITNVAYAEAWGDKIATTSEINHIIQANPNNGEIITPNPGGDDNQEDNNIKDNDIAKGNRSITGIAWYDENMNGKKDQGETTLNNIKVKLLNTETNHFVKEENGQILEATTNKNGVYVLDKIGNGKYIVVFEYDNTEYSLTKYKVDGVAEAENSNVVLNELQIENEKQKVAATDILTIENNHISNINIGLIKKQNFDLKLDKYVSRILIQNAKGTTVREYNNETIAKVELDAKTINGSTAIIEYKIKVTNQGEVEGYAKKIADYVSSELNFSSELNKDWYQVGNTLYTNSLANEKIVPGESKTITLTLTKSMTENSTGLIPNTAEIVEDYNELGIADSNSTPGNKVKEENDFGFAEVVLSIRTGGVVYVTTGMIAIAVLTIVAVIMIKKKNKMDNE